MREGKYCFIILKKWEDVFPDLDYRALEAMYTLMEKNLEICLRVGYSEYLKSMSGQPGYSYAYGEKPLDSDVFTMIFPLKHNRKQTIRREWIDHIEVVEEVINKAWILNFYKNHPELKMP